MQLVCNGDIDLPVKFSVYNYRQMGPHALYGEVVTTVRELEETQKREFPLSDGAGLIRFEQFTVVHRPSFVEYLKSGWFINMSTAIDFTASNGEVTDPMSLHRIHGNRPNDYEMAIQSVGQVLEPYAF